MKTTPANKIAFVFTSWPRTGKESASAPRRRTQSSSGQRAGFRPRLESLEGRTLLSSLPYPTAATVTQLIADINYANTAGGAISINLVPSTTFSLTSANNTTDGGNGLPVISGTNAVDLTITGNADTIQISLPKGSTLILGLFDVAPGASLTLDHVTLQGSDGVAVNNHGTLIINGCILSDNLGGAIGNSGTVTVSNSTVSGNSGAAINNGGTLTISNSTLSGNWNALGGEGRGGGIYNADGTVTLSNSILSDNTADYGGGIYNAGGTVTVSDGSTLTGNFNAYDAYNGLGGFGAGIYIAGGTVRVENSSSINGNEPGDGNNGNDDDDVFSLGALYLDSTSTIGTLDKNPVGLTVGAGGQCAFTENYISGVPNYDIISGAITIDDDLSGFYGSYALTIENGASVVLQSNQQVGQLQLVGNATLDIAGSSLTVDYGSNSDPLSTVVSCIQSGFNGGGWNGSGIISSSAAADTSKATGVGYFDNGSQVTIAHTYYGDTNLDGVVDGNDYITIDNGSNMHLSGWLNGDFNYDGLINGDDYSLVDNAFNTQNVASSDALIAASASDLLAVRTAQVGSIAGSATLVAVRGGKGVTAQNVLGYQPTMAVSDWTTAGSASNSDWLAPSPSIWSRLVDGTNGISAE